MNEENIKTLFTGFDKQMGLLELCGALKKSERERDLKGVAILALELVVWLLEESSKPIAEKCREVLPKIEIKWFQAMNLAQHILSERANSECAFKMVFILSEKLPHTPVSAYIENQEAVNRYEEWLAKLNEDDQKSEEDEDATHMPSTWAEVHFNPNFEAEEETEAASSSAVMDLLPKAQVPDSDNDEDEDPLGQLFSPFSSFYFQSSFFSCVSSARGC
jgi:hypothetical protein